MFAYVIILDSTYFESLFEFGFIHLILDTFHRYLFDGAVAVSGTTVRQNLFSGYQEEKGVNWDLQGGVQTLERYTLEAGSRET
ncbi:hypothetical protein DEO72_LG5g1479 [Vigna unguiculata]|uniref:Uncharacterized protein n=1 Tax=Vigna unguiculata TaxID=3917 RepID=A0A4D6LZZ9_VIGUN|nr:hypothetical protein DEO72_LG5g1479 [Vigna unguiculata]